MRKGRLGVTTIKKQHHLSAAKKKAEERENRKPATFIFVATKFRGKTGFQHRSGVQEFI
jgi:hypothetical protein